MMTEESILEKKTNAFHLRLEKEGIALLSIDVPDSSKNVLQASFVEEINALLDWLGEQKQVTGLVIYSAKSDNFIVGADINMLNACQDIEQAQKIAQQGQRIFDRLASLPFHVVAAIHGSCLGGGLELALACHSRVATEDNITRIGLPEVKLGLLPGSGGTQRLPRLIGTINALDLILSGKALAAKKAKTLALVDEVVPKSILLDVAKNLTLQAKPKRKTTFKNWLLSYNPIGRYFVFNAAKKKALSKTRNNYPAADAILQVVEYGLAKGMQSGLQFEAQRFGQLAVTKASGALRHLFFISNEVKKEKPNQAKPNVIKTVSVLGGGLMGAGIAYVSACQAKVSVQIKDLSNDSLLKALKYSYQLLNKKRQQKQLSTSQLQQQMIGISVATEYESMAACDMVIEAVFEDLSLKHQMIKDVEKHFGVDTIFASNTSSLPIEQIASAAAKPENIIGLHYFSPVEKMPLVEIIPHKTTSEQTIATTVAFAKRQGKMPIVVADKAGFYVNRILASYLNEATQLLSEGEKIETIDDALLDFGFPLGPLSLLDEVGIDICAKVSPVLFHELGERFDTPPLFKLMLKNARLGRKTKKGFYLYRGKKKKVDNQVYSLLGVKPDPQLTAQEMALRCFLSMLNECVRCFDEGIIRSARDGDVGAVFGIGFPPFLGGPFCYMDALGMSSTVKLMKKFQRRYGERFAPCNLLIKMEDEQINFYSENNHIAKQ